MQASAGYCTLLLHAVDVRVTDYEYLIHDIWCVLKEIGNV